MKQVQITYVCDNCTHHQEKQKVICVHSQGTNNTAPRIDLSGIDSESNTTRHACSISCAVQIWLGFIADETGQPPPRFDMQSQGDHS
jgi:hypothetical protein